MTLIIASSLTTQGCSGAFDLRTREEIMKEVLEKDPRFVKLLDKKKARDEKVATLKAELDDKKKLINDKILELRESLRSVKEDIGGKLKEVDAELESRRQELKNRIKSSLTELKLKESSLSATKAMIAKLSRLIERGPSSKEFTKEIPKWQNKIASLRSQADELEKEILYIRERIRLSRLKLKLLR